ncbi:hypothetical protein LZ30DRAFT_714623, partial [Colletotrichum cereale]
MCRACSLCVCMCVCVRVRVCVSLTASTPDGSVVRNSQFQKRQKLAGKLSLSTNHRPALSLSKKQDSTSPAPKRPPNSTHTRAPMVIDTETRKPPTHTFPTHLSICDL